MHPASSQPMMLTSAIDCYALAFAAPASGPLLGSSSAGGRRKFGRASCFKSAAHDAGVPVVPALYLRDRPGPARQAAVVGEAASTAVLVAGAASNGTHGPAWPLA